ncbi:hypothetical protein L195_g021445 [Trifolium pratense]|uniref:Uncharacterized protein n=1 Tax=Trifolium pratense TaxID=57577 RepID=A0A2K3N573_TRIPR|nr:hypothetical protein L195_g021445 [Trifolium pratense]
MKRNVELRLEVRYNYNNDAEIKESCNIVATRGGQRADLGQYGPKTSNRPNPRVEKRSQIQTVLGVRFRRVRAKWVTGYGLNE